MEKMNIVCKKNLEFVCKKHPKYEAKQQPMSKCKKCWDIWYLVVSGASVLQDYDY